MDLNLYEWIKDRKQFIPEAKVKHHMFQAFKAIDHLHRNNIFHRDIKPENILISGETVKLADFGSCKSMNCTLPCTEYISTRWYRPPECLMTDGFYDFKMDIWGAGCVFFEVLALHPLFQGANELDQVNKIHDVLGTPDFEVLREFEGKASHMKFEFTAKVGTGIDGLLPHVSPLGRDLLGKMLAYKVSDRISASKVLKHAYFKECYEERNLLSVGTGTGSNEKCVTILPPIKSSFPTKKGPVKQETSNKTLGSLVNSPYSVKKSILELKRAYAPHDNKFYKSSY